MEEELHSDEMGVFKPPAAFVQASLARQARIRQQMQERNAGVGTVHSVSIKEIEPTPPEPPEPLEPTPPPPPKTHHTHNTTHNTTHQRNPPPKSKTLQTIQNLAQARTHRRTHQNELRAAQAGLDSLERNVLGFKRDIELFRMHLDEDGGGVGERGDARIRVFVRKRPLNDREQAIPSIFDTITPTQTTLHLHEPKTRMDLSKTIETHSFSFDAVFDESVGNRGVYERTVMGMVRNMFEGGRGTVFAYGQTGSGKTHTVFGDGDRTLGLYEYACRDIFQHFTTHHSQSLSLHICFFEIYGGQAYDLLSSRTRVHLLEDAHGMVRIQGLTETPVTSLKSLLTLVKTGTSTRTTGSTEANPDSSRSHAVFQIRLRKNMQVIGKFSVVDLAGSERGVERGNVGKRERFEGAEINKSLLALKECIRALHRSRSGVKQHIPFRASKLTQILRDSFVGARSQTVMIATVSPGSNSVDHSLNTLRYADRVKELRRKGGGGGGGGEDRGRCGAEQQEDKQEQDDNDDDDDDDDDDDEEWDHVDDPLPTLPSFPTVPPTVLTTPLIPPSLPSPSPSPITPTNPDLAHLLRATPPPTSHHITSITHILTTHESLLQFHLSTMALNASLMRIDQLLISTVTQPGADLDTYVEALSDLIARRLAVWRDLEGRVEELRGLLRDEEVFVGEWEEDEGQKGEE
ncbi:hypothetical protein SpCBS45565_g07570 [Spizellomyces sp. 'palustris']|nr:hypothetical protein SpCBS45565_g07570 [Spizellomyces sp. 'palustris']